METVIMDSREKIAADIRAWLEWQQHCGTDVWKVDDASVWDACLQKPIHAAIQFPKFPQPKKPAPIEPSRAPLQTKKNETPSIPKEPKKSPPLPSCWQSVYENRKSSDSLDYSRISSGREGFKKVLEFRDQHCDPKICIRGAGRFDAEVVLVEGHAKQLDATGFKMLSDMRERVLRLSKNNLYWIPLKRDSVCTHCDSVAMGQLNAIQPKAVLILGFGPLALFNIRDRQSAESGLEFQLELNFSSVPAICTHHPMSLIEAPQDKLSAHKALINFRGILNRLRIR